MSSYEARPLPAPRPVVDPVAAPFRLALGLRALRADEPWLDVDADLASDLREKRRLLEERRDRMFVELPESRPAQREALGRVVETLTSRYPHWYRRVSGKLHVTATGDEIDLRADGLPPLEAAARCVQEDLCVMEARRGAWCLTAGAVCFPTRWELAPKLGCSMTTIHERVPGYRATLDYPANRFFDGMKACAVFRRANWSLMDDPALYQPTGKHRTARRPELDGRNAGRLVWLRVEQQTLQRLPRTGAILFGIRIHRTRLDAVARDRDAARALLGAIETMSPAMQRYKSLMSVRDSAVQYLLARLQAP